MTDNANVSSAFHINHAFLPGVLVVLAQPHCSFPAAGAAANVTYVYLRANEHCASSHGPVVKHVCSQLLRTQADTFATSSTDTVIT